MSVLPHPHEENSAVHREIMNGESVAPLMRRIAECVAGGVLILGRTSTPRQFEQNTGSVNFQRSQVDLLEAYGADRAKVMLLEGPESASGKKARPILREALARIESGEVRLVCAAFTDRLSRNDEDFNSLFNALTRANGMLFISGSFYDLRDPNQRLMLDLQATIAKFDNDMRTLRLLTSACQNARRLAYPTVLASGLVWASMEQAEYANAIRSQHMEDVLAQWPDSHKTSVYKNGVELKVLPYPDRAAYEACILRRDWMLETLDLREVLERILHHSDWPKPGCIPMRVAPRTYNPSKPLAWISIQAPRRDGSRVFLRGKLGSWFRSQALYGIYHFRLRKANLPVALAEQMGTRVEVSGAFPAFFAPSDYSRVTEALSRKNHFPRILATATPDRSPEAAFDPILPDVRCSTVLPDGRRCGLKLSPALKNGRTYYRSTDCHARHSGVAILRPQHETIIAERILARLSKEELGPFLDASAQQDVARKQQLVRAEAELQDMRMRAGLLVDEMLRAQKLDNKSSYTMFRRSFERTSEHIAQCEQRTRSLAARLSVQESMRNEDWHAIRSLCDDVPKLFQAAGAVRGLRLQLLRALVSSISTRRIAAGVEFVEICYPTGARDAFLIAVDPPMVPRNICEFALHHVAEQLIGERLTDATGTDIAESELTGRKIANTCGSEWMRSGWVVRAYALQALYSTPSDTRVGYAVSAAIARRVHEPIKSIEQFGMLDKLGPIRLVDGEPQYAPSDAELARVFPDFGRRTVAASIRCKRSELVRLDEAASRTHRSRPGCVYWARRRNALHLDAAGRPWIHWPSFRTLQRKTLDDAVAALGIVGVEAGDFLSAREAGTELRRLVNKGGWPSDRWFEQNRESGRILTVHAIHPTHPAGACWYVYLPQVIRSLHKRREVLDWLRGRSKGLTAWNPKKT